MKSNWCKSSLARAVAGGPVASVAIRRVTGGCEAYTVRKQAASVQPRKLFCRCDADAVSLAEAASGAPTCEVYPGSPGSLVRVMLSKRLPANAGELTISAEWTGVWFTPRQTNQAPEVARISSERSKQILDVAVSRCQGRPEAAGTDRRAVLEPHSTREGGEPQGSGNGRPRYPLEGRRNRADVSRH